MSNRAPDFSSTFDIVDDTLADAEKRLEKKHKAAADAKSNSKSKHEASKEETEKGTLKSEDEKKEPKPVKKAAKKEAARPELQLVNKEHRRNLTLKVLEENERQFNQLFYRLQIAGDARKKQDLADEALTLLFAKYSRL